MVKSKLRMQHSGSSFHFPPRSVDENKLLLPPLDTLCNESTVTTSSVSALIDMESAYSCLMAFSASDSASCFSSPLSNCKVAARSSKRSRQYSGQSEADAGSEG